MEPYDTGESDEDGDPVEIWIAGKEKLKPIISGDIKLSANQKTMFGILHDAGSDGLSTLQWNDKAREVGIGKNRHATLFDIQRALKAKRLVRDYNDRWYVAQERMITCTEKQ